MYEFVQHEINFFIFCLTTLFTLINPIGISPILIIMTERFPRPEKIEIAKKGSLTAFITLILFSLLGSVIFNFFGITLEAFQIMGGILFFRNGMRMLDSKIGRSRTTPAEQEESEESDDIAISPIGIPLIAGPGAITTAMLLSSQTPHLYSHFTLILSIFFCFITCLYYTKKWKFSSKVAWHNRNKNYTKTNGINSYGNCSSIYN